MPCDVRALRPLALRSWGRAQFGPCAVLSLRSQCRAIFGRCVVSALRTSGRATLGPAQSGQCVVWAVRSWAVRSSGTAQLGSVQFCLFCPQRFGWTYCYCPSRRYPSRHQRHRFQKHNHPNQHDRISRRCIKQPRLEPRPRRERNDQSTANPYRRQLRTTRNDQPGNRRAQHYQQSNRIS